MKTYTALAVISHLIYATYAFQGTGYIRADTALFSSNELDATSRFPTSAEDQVRQAAISIKAASEQNIHRHSIRLLLPIIGATELDDWPGGARQMMEAAAPLVNDIMNSKTDMQIQESVIDQADGVRALFGQAVEAKDDMCSILLPSADTVSKLQDLDVQVGKERDMILVNAQWKRRSDFGTFALPFMSNGKDEKITFVEGFEPTYHCSNIMVEGDIVRVLRNYPGPWKVYLRVVDPEDANNINWIEIGSKELIYTKTKEWEEAAKRDEVDGGKLFNYGSPSYDEIAEMIVNREGYVPKSLSERAASAFIFIKDTL